MKLFVSNNRTWRILNWGFKRFWQFQIRSVYFILNTWSSLRVWTLIKSNIKLFGLNRNLNNLNLRLIILTIFNVRIERLGKRFIVLIFVDIWEIEILLPEIIQIFSISSILRLSWTKMSHKSFPSLKIFRLIILFVYDLLNLLHLMLANLVYLLIIHDLLCFSL